ncbi:MAG: hypothetical protein IKO82_08165 [Prevotella sp.]|nr:hypothetical protein [Prevotella sp.]
MLLHVEAKHPHVGAKYPQMGAKRPQMEKNLHSTLSSTTRSAQYSRAFPKTSGGV